MAKIHNGRYRSSVDGDFVVFLIGARLNRLRALNRMWRLGDETAADAPVEAY